MKLFVFLVCVLGSAALALGQNTNPATNPTEEARQAAAQAEADRRRQAGEFARLKSISEEKHRRRGMRITNLDGMAMLDIPDSDKQAIAVGEEIRRKYADLLKRGKAGLLRLQNADICTPNNLIVTAVGGCPNYVTGKATAFSFRTSEYVAPLFSDIFLKGPALTATGAYTIGIFANLGDVDIRNLDVKSEGVHQLAAFVPPTTLTEFERQSAILRRGAQIDKFTYLPKAEINPGNVFVLRSVAYRANLYRGEKPRRINVLAADERADVTIVFRIEAVLSDGSVVLAWRELKKSPPPNVTLEAVTPKRAAPNKFVSILAPLTLRLTIWI